MVVEISPKFSVGDIIKVYTQEVINAKFEKCPICNSIGNNFLPEEAMNSGALVTCSVCNGTGSIPIKVEFERKLSNIEYKIVGIKVKSYLGCNNKTPVIASWEYVCVRKESLGSMFCKQEIFNENDMEKVG